MSGPGTAWTRFVRDEQGTTMVEFSIAAMLVFVLIFGTIDWTRFHYNRARLKHAVREGALYASRMSTDLFNTATVETVTRNALVGSAAERALGTVEVLSTGTDGEDPRVQVTWRNFPLTRATSLVIKAAKLDVVTAELHVEQQ